MHKTICIIGNRSATLEARLFTRAISRKEMFDSFRLVTRCATALEMIAFKEWKRLGRSIDLVIPSNWADNPTSSQRKIVSDTKQTGGKLIDFSSPETNTDSALKTMIRNADLSLIMEISCDHPLISTSSIQLSHKTCAAFQWAVSNRHNGGCRLLLETGRVTPIFPPRYSEQLQAFISGESLFPNVWTQPKLNL